jgi:hypothetical protein
MRRVLLQGRLVPSGQLFDLRLQTFNFLRLYLEVVADEFLFALKVNDLLGVVLSCLLVLLLLLVPLVLDVLRGLFEVGHLDPHFLHLRALLFHALLLLLKLLDGQHQLVPLFEVLLLELHHLLLGLSQLLLRMVVFFLKIFLMVAFGDNLFDVLLVVDDLLLQPEHILVILFLQLAYLLVQLVNFILFTLNQDMVLVFAQLHLLLNFAVFLLQLDDYGLEVADAVSALGVLVLLQLFGEGVYRCLLVHYGVEGRLLHLVEIGQQLAIFLLELINFLYEGLYFLGLLVVEVHESDDLVFFMGKFLVEFPH